jgi:sugar phosphate isomerase/epimerase
MYTRREFGKAALATLPLARGLTALNSTINGVQIGVQSSSFTYSGMGIDAIIKTVTDLGFAEIGVMSEHVENYIGGPVQLPGTGRTAPGTGTRQQRSANGASSGSPTGGSVGRGGVRDPEARAALRKWRMEVGLDRYEAVGRKFKDVGLKFFCYGLSFDDSFSDDEMDKSFLAAKALGTNIIYASSPVTVFPRVAPFAERHNVIVALHNHTIGPDDFAQAMAASRNLRVNLDVGHFVAAGYDPIAYIQAKHADITHIHLKDRKKNQGPEMAFGQGDTPLKEILQLMKKEKYKFPAYIEYVGTDGQAIELKRCLEFCRNALA